MPYVSPYKKDKKPEVNNNVEFDLLKEENYSRGLYEWYLLQVAEESNLGNGSSNLGNGSKRAENEQAIVVNHDDSDKAELCMVEAGFDKGQQLRGDEGEQQLQEESFDNGSNSREEEGEVREGFDGEQHEEEGSLCTDEEGFDKGRQLREDEGEHSTVEAGFDKGQQLRGDEGEQQLQEESFDNGSNSREDEGEVREGFDGEQHEEEGSLCTGEEGRGINKGRQLREDEGEHSTVEEGYDKGQQLRGDEGEQQLREEEEEYSTVEEGFNKGQQLREDEGEHCTLGQGFDEGQQLRGDEEEQPQTGVGALVGADATVEERLAIRDEDGGAEGVEDAMTVDEAIQREYEEKDEVWGVERDGMQVSEAKVETKEFQTLGKEGEKMNGEPVSDATTNTVAIEPAVEVGGIADKAGNPSGRSLAEMGIPKMQPGNGTSSSTETSDIKSTDIERHDNTLAAETLPEGRPSLGLQRSDKIAYQISNVQEEFQIEVTQLNKTPDVFSLASTIPTASISSQVNHGNSSGENLDLESISRNTPEYTTKDGESVPQKDGKPPSIKKPEDLLYNNGGATIHENRSEDGIGNIRDKNDSEEMPKRLYRATINREEISTPGTTRGEHHKSGNTQSEIDIFATEAVTKKANSSSSLPLLEIEDRSLGPTAPETIFTKKSSAVQDSVERFSAEKPLAIFENQCHGRTALEENCKTTKATKGSSFEQDASESQSSRDTQAAIVMDSGTAGQISQGNGPIPEESVPFTAGPVQSTSNAKSLSDEELKSIAAAFNLDASQGMEATDSIMPRQQLRDLLKGAQEMGVSSWAQFFKVFSLSHTSRLPNQRVLAQVSQWFGGPGVAAQMSDAVSKTGRMTKLRFKGITIWVLHIEGGGRAKAIYNNARAIIDPCTLKSVANWKLITKTDAYQSIFGDKFTEPLSATTEKILEVDNDKILHFGTMKDISRNFTIGECGPGLSKVVWKDETESLFTYLGDFPIHMHWGDNKEVHAIRPGYIAVVKEDLFPRGKVATDGSEIWMVLGQDFIEHKQYYKYVIKRGTNDLLLDWDFTNHRSSHVKFELRLNSMSFFVDGFYREGTEWAAMFHRPGSWYNGIVLLSDNNNSVCDNEVPITLKALWKSLMQTQDLMVKVINTQMTFKHMFIFVLKRDIADAFEDDCAVIKKWERNGWTKGNGMPVANRELWEQLILAIHQMRALLGIEVSIRYSPPPGFELARFERGIESLKVLKQYIPSFLILRRPDVANYFANLAALNNTQELMGINLSEISTRGSQCDFIQPNKLRDLAKQLESEGCLKCSNVHKIFPPAEQVGEGLNIGMQDACPLLSRLPYSIANESSVARETITKHSLLGPYNESGTSEIFGHQLCLCSPDSNSMSQALAILCDTHVIVYGHRTWIAMNKRELIMALALADEVGLVGSRPLPEEDSWLKHIKRKLGGPKAFEEYKKERADVAKKPVQKRKKKRAKGKKWMFPGQNGEAEQEDSGDDMGKNDLATTVSGEGRPGLWKGKGKGSMQEPFQQTIDEKAEEAHTPTQRVGDVLEEPVDGGDELILADMSINGIVDVSQNLKALKEEGKDEHERGHTEGREGKQEEKSTDGTTAKDFDSSDDEFDEEEMGRELQKYKNLAANNWKAPKDNISDAGDEVNTNQNKTKKVAKELIGNRVPEFAWNELPTEPRLGNIDSIADDGDDSSTIFEDEPLSDISSLDLVAAADIEPIEESESAEGGQEQGGDNSTENPSPVAQKAEWVPEGRSWADYEDDSEADDIHFSELYSNLNKFNRYREEADQAKAIADGLLKGKGKSSRIDETAVTEPSVWNTPWKNTVPQEAANSRKTNQDVPVDISPKKSEPLMVPQKPATTAREEIKEKAKETALDSDFPGEPKEPSRMLVNADKQAVKNDEYGEEENKMSLMTRESSRQKFEHVRKTREVKQKQNLQKQTSKAVYVKEENAARSPMGAWEMPATRPTGAWGMVTPPATDDSKLNQKVFPTLGSAVGKGKGKVIATSNTVKENGKTWGSFGATGEALTRVGSRTSFVQVGRAPTESALAEEQPKGRGGEQKDEPNENPQEWAVVQGRRRNRDQGGKEDVREREDGWKGRKGG